MGQGFDKVIKMHSLGTMGVCAKFHGNLSIVVEMFHNKRQTNTASHTAISLLWLKTFDKCAALVFIATFIVLLS